MLAYELDTHQTTPPVRARMEQRTSAEAKALIERAARSVGLSASDFTVAAACKAARETIASYEATKLSQGDHDAFMSAFAATEPRPALVELMRLHAEVAE